MHNLNEEDCQESRDDRKRYACAMLLVLVCNILYIMGNGSLTHGTASVHGSMLI